MTKFKVQYEGGVDGLYAVLDRFAGDERFTVKVEMEVTVTEGFEHPPNPTEDWGDPEVSLQRQEDRDFPEPPKPMRTLGDILKEKLGDKLLLNSLTGRCLKALGYVYPSSDFLLQHEKIQKLLPEALETLHNRGYWACVDFLEASTVPHATPMVDVLLQEGRPVMAIPPGHYVPIQAATLPSYNELAKGCMQFYKGTAESAARDEMEIKRWLPEALNMIPKNKLDAIKLLRERSGIGLREAKNMVLWLEQR